MNRTMMHGSTNIKFITQLSFRTNNLRQVPNGLGMEGAGFVQPGIRKALASTLSRSARSFSVLCFIKANDRIIGIRNIHASGGARLLVHPSESQFTSIQMYVTLRQTVFAVMI